MPPARPFLAFAGLFLLGSILRAEPSSPPTYSEEAVAADLLWDEWLTIPKAERSRIGLALGGGGARGLVHIGVLKVLDEERFPIDSLSGTSVGALIGALYAGGVSPQKMELFAQDVGWRDLTDFATSSLLRLIFRQKLLSSAKMEEYLRQQIGARRFDELPIEFTCVATDLLTGEKIIFREGEVAIAARASATVPGIFEPVPYRHRFLVDGGLVDNLPIELVRKTPEDIAIASIAQPDFETGPPETVLRTLHQSIYILGEQLTRQKLRAATLAIQPKIGAIGVLDITKGRQLIDAGVVETRRQIIPMKGLVITRDLTRILKGSHQ